MADDDYTVEEIAAVIGAVHRIGTDAAGRPVFNGHFGLQYEDGREYHGMVFRDGLVDEVRADADPFLLEVLAEFEKPLDPDGPRSCQESMLRAALTDEEEG